MRQTIEGLRLELAEYQKANTQRNKNDVGIINELITLSQALLDSAKTDAELQAARQTILDKSTQKKSGVFNTPLINKVLNFAERCLTFRTEKDVADKKTVEAQQARSAKENADRKAAEEKQARLAKEAADIKAAEEEKARLTKETADRKAAEELQARLTQEAADRKASEEAQAQLARETSAREQSFLTQINAAVVKLKLIYLQNGGNRTKADREIFNMTGVAINDRAAMTAKFIAIVQKLREGKPGKASSKTLPKVPELAEALGIVLPPVTAVAASTQSRWANFPFGKKPTKTQKQPESKVASALTM